MPEGARHEPKHGSEARDAVSAEGGLPQTKYEQEIAWRLEAGLPAAASVVARSIPTFRRGELPHFAGISPFLKQHFLEDVRQCGNCDIPTMLDFGLLQRAQLAEIAAGVRQRFSHATIA